MTTYTNSNSDLMHTTTSPLMEDRRVTSLGEVLGYIRNHAIESTYKMPKNDIENYAAICKARLIKQTHHPDIDTGWFKLSPVKTRKITEVYVFVHHHTDTVLGSLTVIDGHIAKLVYNYDLGSPLHDLFGKEIMRIKEAVQPQTEDTSAHTAKFIDLLSSEVMITIPRAGEVESTTGFLNYLKNLAVPVTLPRDLLNGNIFSLLKSELINVGLNGELGNLIWLTEKGNPRHDEADKECLIVVDKEKILASMEYTADEIKVYRNESPAELSEVLVDLYKEYNEAPRVLNTANPLSALINNIVDYNSDSILKANVRHFLSNLRKVAVVSLNTDNDFRDMDTEDLCSAIFESQGKVNVYDEPLENSNVIRVTRADGRGAIYYVYNSNGSRLLAAVCVIDREVSLRLISGRRRQAEMPFILRKLWVTKEIPQMPFDEEVDLNPSFNGQEPQMPDFAVKTNDISSAIAAGDLSIDDVTDPQIIMVYVERLLEAARNVTGNQLTTREHRHILNLTNALAVELEDMEARAKEQSAFMRRRRDRLEENSKGEKSTWDEERNRAPRRQHSEVDDRSGHRLPSVRGGRAQRGKVGRE